MGRVWLDVLFPKWREVFTISQLPVSSTCNLNNVTENLQKMFPSVFNGNDEPIKQFKASLTLKDPNAKIFAKAYNLRFGMIPIVEQLLENLLTYNKIVQVAYSENASPCFSRKKKNGSYRLCIDFKRTLYKLLHVDQYP